MTKHTDLKDNAALRPTIQAALELIDSWGDLPETRRRDLKSAVSLQVRLQELPASVARLDPVRSLELLERASPKSLGVLPSTLSNRRAATRYVLRRLGLLAPTRIATPKTTDPVWAPLLATLPPGVEFGRLRALGNYCAAEGIAPPAVDNATLNAYAERRAAEHGGAKARDHARRVGVQWNLAAKKVAGWPQTRLGLRAKPLQYSGPFNIYEPSLQAAVDRYLKDIGAPQDTDLFSGEDRAKPLKASTVTGREYCLRRLLWGAVQNGIAIESLTSLRQIPTPEFIKATFRWHHIRAGEVNGDLGQLAATVASIAKHQKLSADEWEKIRPLLAKATPEPRHEITEQLAQLLDKICEPEKCAQLLHLPLYAMRDADRMRDGWVELNGRAHPPRPEEAAWLAATATAIEILLHAPMRLTNLQNLRIGEELQIAQVRRAHWKATIFVAGTRVKGKRSIEIELVRESIDLIREYIDGLRSNLPNAGSNWLFPGRGNSENPRHKGAFGQAITETIESYIGLRVNPHAFRAFAGAMILERDPHAIDDVRALLGHATFETALIYYRRNSQREASKRLSATLSRKRQDTKLTVKTHFLATELRRRVRRW